MELRIVSDEPLWKKLVDDLRQKGNQSRFLERLRERVPVAGGREAEREILEEMASALGRAQDKVNVALLRLELEQEALDVLASATVRDDAWQREASRRLEAFRVRREDAIRARWELMVHREALGFRRNENLARDYPIPPARTTL